MGFHRTTAESNAGAEEQTGDKAIVFLPSSAAELRMSKADRVKGVTRSLVIEALAVLDEMWEDCQESPNLTGKCYLLYHYLGYLKRFCEGKA
jgi:hypothetical protein